MAYGATTEPALAGLTAAADPPPSAAVVSHKHLSIDDVVSRFFADVEQNYPSIVANVARTTAKLDRLSISSGGGGEGVCRVCATGSTRAETSGGTARSETTRRTAATCATAARGHCARKSENNSGSSCYSLATARRRFQCIVHTYAISSIPTLFCIHENVCNCVPESLQEIPCSYSRKETDRCRQNELPPCSCRTEDRQVGIQKYMERSIRRCSAWRRAKTRVSTLRISFVRLLGQAERQDGVGQYSGEMRQEALVDGEQALGAHRLGQAVDDAAVQVAVLVVEPGHDGVWRGGRGQHAAWRAPGGRERGGEGKEWKDEKGNRLPTRGVHEDADDEAADGATGQVQQRALVHAEVAHEAALGEEVGGQLHGAAEAGADHGGADAAVQAARALGGVDLAQAVPGVAVVVLGADGQEGRVALQPRLDQEERGCRRRRR